MKKTFLFYKYAKLTKDYPDEGSNYCHGVNTTKLDGDGYVTVGSMEIEIEFPDDIEVDPIAIVELEKEIVNIQAESQLKVNHIKGEIESLRALPDPSRMSFVEDV